MRWTVRLEARTDTGEVVETTELVTIGRPVVGEWQKPGALRRELDCLLAEASVQHRGPDLKHAVGAPG